jgi:hypothetical protein
MKYLTYISLLAAAVSAAPAEAAEGGSSPGVLIASPNSPSQKNGELVLARFSETA